MFSTMDFFPTFASPIGSKMPTDRPIDGSVYPTVKPFWNSDTNEYPNRAWVSATLCGKYVPGDWEASDCRPYNQYKFRVAGLIYDGSSGQIRLGKHVCAWVENGFLRPISRQTGQCGLNINTIPNVYDDGFQKTLATHGCDHHSTAMTQAMGSLP
jgi:hypothetical protein